MRKIHNNTYLYEFDEITNEIEAYTLGLMLSDGNVGQSLEQSKITVHANDEYILEEIRDYIVPEVEIGNDKSCKILRFSNTYLNTNLVNKYGIVPNKVRASKLLPIIRDDLTRHLIRGIFDGDGTVVLDKSNGAMKLSIGCIDIILMEDLCKKINEEGIYCVVNIERRKGKSLKKVHTEEMTTEYQDLARVLIRRKEEVVKFYDYMYKDSNIFMKRKEEKIRLHVNTVLRPVIIYYVNKSTGTV